MKKDYSFLATKPKVVTIGGGNGHSVILGAIQKSFLPNINLSSIVSMSDDGRTTGRLIRHFDEDLGIHFPPPGDVRRCLYFLSGSVFREDFERCFETVIRDDVPMKDLTLGQIAQKVGAYDFLKKMNFPLFEIILPIESSLEGHKFGNILMGTLFYHFDQDYNKMVEFMHEFLLVGGNVIPVTTDKAFIQATLSDGTIIERQDHISNIPDYEGRIEDLSLMPDSVHAQHNPRIAHAIQEADYIVLTPGDLYTSLISNLIIGGVPELIQKSQAKIIFIANTTNKGGETEGYQIADFVNELNKYIGRNINILVTNNQKLKLSREQQKEFKNDISVKGGEHLYLTDEEKKDFQEKGIHIVEADLLDEITMYKHNQRKIAQTLEQILFHDLVH